MELLEAREAALRSRVLGATASKPSTHTSHTILDRVQRINAQLEQLNGTIMGFARLADLYNANRELIEVNRNPPVAEDDTLKRAVILSSEDHIAGVVTEFKRLQNLQQYIARLEQLHSTSAQAQHVIGGIELTHGQQEERALLLHARVENILGVYQEMVQVLSEKCVEYSAVLDQLTA